MKNHYKNLKRLKKVINACHETKETSTGTATGYDLSALYLMAFDYMKTMGVKKMSLKLLSENGKPVALSIKNEKRVK